MTRGNRQDPDADQLFAELAGVVRAEIKRRGTSAKAVSRTTRVAESSLQAFLNGCGISLDTFAALARWAGYGVALTPRPDGSDTPHTPH